MSFDPLMVLMRNGNTYVNVHTTANPSREIRGQVATQEFFGAVVPSDENERGSELVG